MPLRLFYYNITFNCNNNCLFCCSHNTREHNTQSVDIRFIENVNVEYHFNEDDYFVITGGEPTISPKFEDIITYLSTFSKHIILYTNGRLLNKYSSSIVSKLERIIIPIYGNETQHNRYVRAENAFAETLQSIDIINKIDPNIIEIKLVIGNIQNLNALANFIELNEWIIQTKHISVDKLIIGNNNLEIDDELISAIEKLIIKLHAKGKSVKFYDWPFCHFSTKFQKDIRECYSKRDDVSFKIICCPINHIPFPFEFNSKARFFSKCTDCTKSLFCSQIMNRYYCPVWEADKCWIGTE